MIQIVKITPDNWGKYSKAVTELEQSYPEELRSGEDDIADMISTRGSLSFAALSEGLVAGAVFGYPLDDETIEDYYLADICSSGKGDIYLESITVSERFQGKGVGQLLMAEFNKQAQLSGYKRVVGHYRINGSLLLAKKNGSREIRTEHDWFGTGEDFVCCIKDLQPSE